MSWFVFVRLHPESRFWAMAEFPLLEMTEIDVDAAYEEVIMSRDEALRDPLYREAVLAWDRGDSTEMEKDFYLHSGVDPAAERARELREIHATDWEAWSESLRSLDRNRELIEAYWLHHRGSTLDPQGQDPNFWAWEAVGEKLEQDPEEAWVLLLDLVRTAPYERALGYMTAGVLEDLIKDHGPRFIERIEAEARRSPRFLMALSGVWLNDEDDPEVVARIGRLVPEDPNASED